jgi:hypothetical protein
MLTTTFEALVESMQGLQRIADEKIDDPDQKIHYIRAGVRILGAGEFIDTKVMVTAATVMAKTNMATESERLLFSSGLMFIGNLSLYGYLFDPDLPIDSLALNFTEPDVIGIGPEEVPTFQKMTFQVPVLAIDSCLAAELQK